MAAQNVYDVRFEVVKLSTAPSGPVYMYRKGPRRALVIATSVHPKDIMTTLTSDITLASGEAIEILSASQAGAGTEGTQVLA